jgi:hypothetical protein
MPEDTIRDCTPAFNGNPPNDLALATAGAGGVFPTAGRFSAKVWALLLGCNEDTVRGYVRDFDIPYRMPGREMFIEANDFWAVLPVVRPSDTKPKRGGNRRKKGR